MARNGREPDYKARKNGRVWHSYEEKMSHPHSLDNVWVDGVVRVRILLENYGTGLNRGGGQHEYDCHLCYVGHTCNYATTTSGVARGGTRGGSRGKDTRMWAVVAGKKGTIWDFSKKNCISAEGPTTKACSTSGLLSQSGASKKFWRHSETNLSFRTNSNVKKINAVSVLFLQADTKCSKCLELIAHSEYLAVLL